MYSPADNLVPLLDNSHFAMTSTFSLQYTPVVESDRDTRDRVQLTEPLSLEELRQGITQESSSVTVLPFDTKTDT
jgi:hypothetical protein